MMNNRDPELPGSALQRTLWPDPDAPDTRVCTIDQTRLPFQRLEITFNNMQECAHAIRTMQVRGAPLIGAVGAYGLAMALNEDSGDGALQLAYDKLLTTRPTAVNLRWALERVADRVRPLPPGERAAVAWQAAHAICEEDVACNRRIGEHCLTLLKPLCDVATTDKPVQILTHCNAGSLATVCYGTALAPIYLMSERGIAVHVWVDETRPRNQGASLTAWELAQAGIAHTVIADSAGGLLMMRGEVDAVIVGCDRVAANGDVVNKIGTYLHALAANAHNVPLYVACPTSTIDMRCAHGSDVPIEYRDATEVSQISGVDLTNPENPTAAITTVRLIPEQSGALNPAFDITPADLVTRLITEGGACDADRDSIKRLGLPT